MLTIIQLNRLHFLSVVNDLLYYIVYGLANNIIFLQNSEQMKDNSLIWGLVVSMTILQSIYIFMPCFIGVIVCITIPFFICYLRYVSQKSMKKISKKLLEQLKEDKYKNVELEEKSCHICMVDYKKEDRLLFLPCNKRYRFIVINVVIIFIKNVC